ncbi:MAG: S41 family peptidase [Bacteroidales bacterium]|nr:S41 family peptidase [Bacteroidales bacterium]MDD2425106.1 S41 family peptidase [Bacteroidales bacterium]MDD3988609.1 S41 family peptidase [Bacteroidales bacterium]MDD4639457.1 S41 family peptidase [Bacteroidales bacterium]
MKTFISGLLLISTLSCDKSTNQPSESDKIKNYLFGLMNDIYYWYKEIPKNIDPKPINSIYDYFDTLLVNRDRWSWMMSGEDYQASETGIYLTYGANFGQAIDHYNDYSVRVRYVFENSPMSEHGVKRGYILTHLNSIPVMDLIANNTFNTVMNRSGNNFTFTDYNGTPFSFYASAREVSTRSVLKTMVVTSAEFPGLPYPVGYYNYYSFKAGMLSDIEDAMAVFKSAGIRELILDMRYNSGGDGTASQLLANYIAPASAQGKIVARRRHNDKLSEYDDDAHTMTVVSRVANSLDLNRLVILAGKGTASASEVIINGFDPLINLMQIGTTTYGKPNGMYVWFYPENEQENPDFVFLPIAFFSVNSLGYGEYEDGIEPDHYRPDDLYHDFGLQEDWLRAALTYITTGTFPPLPPAQFPARPLSKPEILTTEEHLPGYGIYKAKLSL